MASPILVADRSLQLRRNYSVIYGILAIITQKTIIFPLAARLLLLPPPFPFNAKLYIHK